MSSSPTAGLAYLDAFATPTQEAWRAAVDKVLKGGDFEKRLVGRSADGIRIEPLYSSASPNQRPHRATHGRWHVAARMDPPSAREAQSLAMADLEGGADTLVISFAGARAARGFGLAATNVDALDQALDGVMLDLIAIKLDPAPQGQAHASLLAGLVEMRGMAPDGLDISFGLDPIGVLASHGVLSEDWAATGKGLTEAVARLGQRGFKGPFVTVDSRPYHEAGASEAQELGAALSTAVAYLRALESHGLDLATARDAISFTLVADTDEFMTIAKFRAARLLWDRIQAACGLAPVPMALHAETAWRSLTQRDPWVNLLRGTIATFGAGVGGADSLMVQPFTAALGLPDAFARRIARNTQLVLLEEASLWRVADPAAGAGSFEALTQSLCEQAWEVFQKLEGQSTAALTGILAGLANGAVAADLAGQRQVRARAIASRREPITGTSEFPNLKEAAVTVLDVGPSEPAPAAASAAAVAVPPLPCLRLSEPFEALRDKADALPKRPVVFLATLGSIADFAARAGFARNLFEAGGLAAPSGDGFAAGGGTDLTALAAAFRASGARLACLCGSDASYAAEGAAAAEALKSAGAKDVWLAGRPGEIEAALNQAGVTSFIYAGCDVLDALTRAQAASA